MALFSARGASWFRGNLTQLFDILLLTPLIFSSRYRKVIKTNMRHRINLRRLMMVRLSALKDGLGIPLPNPSQVLILFKLHYKFRR